MLKLETSAKLKAVTPNSENHGEDNLIPAMTITLHARISADDVLPAMLFDDDDVKSFKKVFWGGAGHPILSSDNGMVFKRKIGPLKLTMYDSFLDDKTSNQFLQTEDAVLVEMKAMFAEDRAFDCDMKLQFHHNISQGGELSVRKNHDVFVTVEERKLMPAEKKEQEEEEEEQEE